MRSSSRSSLASLVVISSLLANCGGGSGTSPDPVPTPAAPNAVRTVLDTQSFSLKAGAATYKNIDFPPEGMIDAIVDWAGTNDINVYVTDNVCPGFVDLKAGRCNVITKAEDTAKPERVSFATTTAPGKIWTFWIYNNGSGDESGSIEMGVTTQGPIPAQSSPSAPSATPAPGCNNPTCTLAEGPVVRYTIKVRTIDTGKFKYRDPTQDENGRWIVHPDEFVVFDSTQKNAAGNLCQVQSYPPHWSKDDPGNIMSFRDGQNNPFLLRTDINKKGEVSVQASVDGIDSNVLELISVAR
jgi:hypothetical protein